MSLYAGLLWMAFRPALDDIQFFLKWPRSFLSSQHNNTARCYCPRRTLGGQCRPCRMMPVIVVMVMVVTSPVRRRQRWRPTDATNNKNESKNMLCLLLLLLIVSLVLLVVVVATAAISDARWRDCFSPFKAEDTKTKGTAQPFFSFRIRIKRLNSNGFYQQVC